MNTARNLKVYFPNLNGLRFIAACFVIINHVEQLKPFFKIGEGSLPVQFRIIGKLGVMLFFVLSGFLITYLLLSEERNSRTIHTGKFYIRRFLRIAPLYALIIIIVFFVLHNATFWTIPNMRNPMEDSFYTILALHLVFFPNLSTAIYGFIPYIAPAWSIGTEEQSYLLWPLLLRRFKKNRIRLMLGIIIFYLSIKIFFWLPFITIPYEETIAKFWNHFNIDSIAIGGFLAVLLFQKHKLLKLIINLKVFYLVTILTVGMIVMGITIPFFHFFVYSVLFGIIIINLAANPYLKKVLEGSVINYLGRISYGIYMYHFIILIPVLVLVSTYNLGSNWIIYPLVLVITIGISSISYHYFEAIFLRIKTKYTVVKSGGSKF